MSVRPPFIMVAQAPSISSLSGKYRVLAQLGQGGTADVSLAVSRGPKGFNKLVVLKSMRPQFRTEEGFDEMFMVEARLAAQLSHPNIVQTNEVFDFEGLPVIVMEYLEGQPLSAVLSRARKQEEDGFPREMQLRVLSECLSALEYAHNLRDFKGTDMGLVHRDVSPHNVFVTYDGQIKLLDFGIAKLNSSQVETATGVIKGKLRYMPPEQITGEGVDRRSDIFALGVMLWEAATGKKMWADASEANIMNAVLNNEVPTPSSLAQGVPEELEHIVMRALSFEKKDRYQTATEMQTALDEFISNQGAHLRNRDIGKRVEDLFRKVHDETRAIVREQLAKVTALSDEEVMAFQPIELTGIGTITGASHAQATITNTNVGPKNRSAIIIALLGALTGAVLLSLWQLKLQNETTEAILATQTVVRVETIRVRITGFPATSSLVLDGMALPSNPYTRTFEKSENNTKLLKVSASGYEDATRKVPMDQDIDMVVTLRALPKAIISPAATDGRIDPRPSPRLHAPRSQPKGKASDCSPPYFIDSRGVKKFKPGCL